MICTGCFNQQAAAPTFNTECRNSHQDQIGINASQGQVIFSVASKTGIGRGNIKLVNGEWSAKVLLHLHLKGLEGLNISTGSKRVELNELKATKHESGPVCFYEVELPNELLIDTNELNLQWVDFYR